MTAVAIVMMIVSILLVWGGLVASIVALRSLESPEVQVDDNGNVIDNPALGTGIW